MSTIKVSMADYPREFERWAKEHTKDLHDSALNSAMQAVPELVNNSPVDTGLYAASWAVDSDGKNVFLGNTAPHAAIIEFGARPFTPPIAPLLAWAKRVLQDPSQPPDYSPRVWALAIGTRNKIKRVGMEPKGVMQKSIPGIIERIKQDMEKRFG